MSLTSTACRPVLLPTISSRQESVKEGSCSEAPQISCTTPGPKSDRLELPAAARRVRQPPVLTAFAFALVMSVGEKGRLKGEF